MATPYKTTSQNLIPAVCDIDHLHLATLLQNDFSHIPIDTIGENQKWEREISKAIDRYHHMESRNTTTAAPREKRKSCSQKILRLHILNSELRTSKGMRALRSSRLCSSIKHGLILPHDHHGLGKGLVGERSTLQRERCDKSNERYTKSYQAPECCSNFKDIPFYFNFQKFKTSTVSHRGRK
jgi:hypothetical protein